jgi:3-polyprenyl-4-hydroxybenzoate decarboxylase
MEPRLCDHVSGGIRRLRGSTGYIVNLDHAADGSLKERRPLVGAPRGATPQTVLGLCSIAPLSKPTAEIVPLAPGDRLRQAITVDACAHVAVVLDRTRDDADLRDACAKEYRA